MNDDLEASQIFIAEAQDLQASIERNLLDLSEDPENRDLIDALFRELHTLKGSAAMFGFAPLSGFVHEFETAFETLRTPDGKASDALITVALAACDHFEPLLTDPDSAVAESDPILDRLRAALGEEGEEASSEQGYDDDDGYDDQDEGDDGYDDAGHGDEDDGAPASGQWHLSFSLGEEALSLGINPIGLLDELRELGGEDTTVCVDLSKLEPLKDADPQQPRLIWHVTLPAHVEQAGLDDVFMFVMDDLDLTITPPGQAPNHAASAGDETAEVADAPDPAPKEAEEKPAAAPEKPAKAQEAEKPKPAAAPSSMRVTTERLDELMDRVGELVIAEARLHELSAVLGDGALLSVAEDIRRLTSGMRDTTMTIRMVPIGSLFGRFRRLVHDLSGQLGKPMDLVTIGGETELDKTVIETLAAPLVHIIRNSVDHGIEKPDLRASAGKDETGRIEISANQEGAEVVIQIRDDGAGLDLERIRARAIERGLIGESETISDADMRMMIFEPGFSTAPEITALSGRGVGMDVVRTTMEALRGRIEVDSTLGAGTTVTMRLPLTLAIIDGLLVQIGEERYTLPLAAIEECVELPAELVENDGQSNFLSVRDGLVPFLRLADLFNVPGPRSPYQKVVIVGSSVGRVGLVVDHIVTTNQTVIKQLSRLHAGLKSFSGATILGDGSVALILDVSNLIAEGRRLEERGRGAERVA